jgi:hypothetical protein
VLVNVETSLLKLATSSFNSQQKNKNIFLETETERHSDSGLALGALTMRSCEHTNVFIAGAGIISMDISISTRGQGLSATTWLSH